MCMLVSFITAGTRTRAACVAIGQFNIYNVIKYVRGKL